MKMLEESKVIGYVWDSKLRNNGKLISKEKYDDGSLIYKYSSRNQELFVKEEHATIYESVLETNASPTFDDIFDRIRERVSLAKKFKRDLEN